MRVVVWVLLLCCSINVVGQTEEIASSLNENMATFSVVTDTEKAMILYDKNGSPLDSIVSHLLAEDIFKVTNYKPKVVTTLQDAKGHVIVIGNIHSKLIKTFITTATLKPNFEKQWESYVYKTVIKPTQNIDKAFVISGTNNRGTAYGAFTISQNIGVNPWYWWADVPTKQRSNLKFNYPETYYSQTPSVTYRGIFLNDEDWGLQPWAAKTFEPELGDIGPKTYAKIFELLLRLKANTIWPAMHPSTKAFFYYDDNPKMAELYNIVIGTSHAEPMLRNNVDEWDKTTRGAFNYKTNKKEVFRYWEDRVKTAKTIDAIYSMGMRGVHDSGMEGVKSTTEAIAVLDGVLADQRRLLQTYVNKDVTQIPQAFTVYKEVLDLYKNGLEVPDDITLVWTDDNYGYIRALSNTEEQKRAGGSGVYYHASYWGRPHDYLWLSTTHPGLIREEMMKAYETNNKALWILNVGDIKPAEYNMQLFLDMAYHAQPFQNSEYLLEHQQQFYASVFGEMYGQRIADITSEYYQLAFERKPEFMGWSQTEKTTPIYNTAYTALGFGDENNSRILAYENLEHQVDEIEKELPENLQASFFQFVGYPVKASSNMNKKFLYRDKAMLYNKQGRQSATFYKTLSDEAFQNIETLTQKYNAIAGGKWKGIMDMKPRRLPVFDKPEIPLAKNEDNEGFGLFVEASQGESLALPVFYINDQASYFIDVFLKSAKRAQWSFKNLPNWISVSQSEGTLDQKKQETRIQVAVDWQLWKQNKQPKSAILSLESEDFKRDIQVTVSDSYLNVPSNTVVEKHGLAVVYATNFSLQIPSHNKQWAKVTGLGHSGNVMQALPLQTTFTSFNESPVLTYDILTETKNDTATLHIVALPTHPLTTDGDVRIGVQWNNGEIKTLSFKTQGRTEQSKQNVLSNKAIQTINVPINTSGKQQLKIYSVDAGVLLDYIVLQTNEASELPYGMFQETTTD